MRALLPLPLAFLALLATLAPAAHATGCSTEASDLGCTVREEPVGGAGVHADVTDSDVEVTRCTYLPGSTRCQTDTVPLGP